PAVLSRFFFVRVRRPPLPTLFPYTTLFRSRFVNAVQSTLRTNFFQHGEGGEPKPYLSLKLDSHAVDELPLPRPLVEIFVHSPRVDAVHLRGGKVARGGIRWSDRKEDFRTEIL